MKGPCQPKGHRYSKRKIYNRNKSFHDEWFTNHPWLEYSIGKDATFCFYCYLFKQPRTENYGVDSFTVVGFLDGNDRKQIVDSHGNDIDHNNARRDYEDYKNQRQSVSHVMQHGGKKSEEQKCRLIVILGVIRFLLLQDMLSEGMMNLLASSSNKGNFSEMIQW